MFYVVSCNNLAEGYKWTERFTRSNRVRRAFNESATIVDWLDPVDNVFFVKTTDELQEDGLEELIAPLIDGINMKIEACSPRVLASLFPEKSGIDDWVFINTQKVVPR